MVGGPGTGKTFTCQAIENALLAQGKRCFACSFQWSACYKMQVKCEKSTIHSLLRAGFSSLTPEMLHANNWPIEINVQAFKTAYEDVEVFIVDEVSTLTSSLFVALETMLRMAFDRTKSFGGKSVILLGDFCQISPIKNTSLAGVLVSYASAVKMSKSSLTPKDHVFQQAGALLSQFRNHQNSTPSARNHQNRSLAGEDQSWWTLAAVARVGRTTERPRRRWRSDQRFEQSRRVAYVMYTHILKSKYLLTYTTYYQVFFFFIVLVTVLVKDSILLYQVQYHGHGSEIFF